MPRTAIRGKYKSLHNIFYPAGRPEEGNGCVADSTVSFFCQYCQDCLAEMSGQTIAFELAVQSTFTHAKCRCHLLAVVIVLLQQPADVLCLHVMQ